MANNKKPAQVGMLAHETDHPAVADVFSVLVDQVVSDAPKAIGAPRLGVDPRIFALSSASSRSRFDGGPSRQR
jgi:hypothetical protein